MLKSRQNVLLFVAVVLAPLACDSKSPTAPSPPACTYTLSSTSLSVGSEGGADSVSVTTAANCAWSATSDRGWMTISGGSSGTGSGVVSITLTPNPNESTRTGTLTVAGKTVAVSQEGAGACAIDISPSSASYNKDSVTGTFTVSAAAHCGWTATSNAAWLAVTSGSTGTGNGSVAYSVETNRGVSPRMATITVAGRTFTVNQAGDAPGCEYSVSASSLSVGAEGGSNSVAVATVTACAWTAVSYADWITVATGSSGSGNGSVGLNVTANPGATARNGTVTIAGHVVTVHQDAQAPCTVDISPSSASYNSNAVAGSFAVIAHAQCAWSATSNAVWLTVTSGSGGTGNGTVEYAAARNTDTAARTGTIVVGPRTFTVVQAGDIPICDYSVSPVEFSACMSATTLTATITTQQGCTWTAAPDAPWITVVGGQTVSGSGVVTFRLSDNWASARQGVVKVRWPTPTAGQNLQVSQAGCRYWVSTSAIGIAAAGGTGKFDVSQASDPITCGGPLQNACLWTATSDVPWITITTTLPQKGDNPVSFTVAPNDSGVVRTGRITVRDKVVVITQPGS